MHSIIAPSASARRVQCPLSTTAEAKFPDGDTVQAAEGEAAHWGLAEMLHGRTVAAGLIAPNGVYLTDEMLEAADVMYDDIADTLRPFGLTPDGGDIEKQIRIRRIHPESFGTPDYSIWLNPRHLAVWDFKYGHRYVEVHENRQLIEYVAGLLPEDVDDRLIDVTVKIVQPRSYHRGGPVRTWSFKASDIRGLINIASFAAREALGPNPRAFTGPECRDCKARHACPTFQRAAYNAIDEAGCEQPHEMSPEALGVEYTVVALALDRLTARKTGLEQQIAAISKSGVRVPGWTVERGSGRTRWALPIEQVLALGAMAGINLAKPPELITPRQAEAKGFPLSMFAGATETPAGSLTVVRDDESRVSRVFGNTSA